MGLIFSMTTLGLSTLLVASFSLFYIHVKMTYRYFEERGIPYDKPHFPCGSFTSLALLKQSLSEALAEIYMKHKHRKLVGFYNFWKIQILINDPEVIKNILVKDFELFIDRGVYYNKKKDPLSAHLFALDGVEWRPLRAKLTPTFSSGKIKGMFSNIFGCAKKMTAYVSTSNSIKKSVDLHSLFSRFGLSVISTTAFGLDSDVFTCEDSMFVKMTDTMLEPTLGRMLVTTLMFNRQFAKWINMRVIPRPASEYFMGLVKEVLNFREKNIVVRNDYLELLIQLKKEVCLSEGDLAAEVFVFILAGSETTSSTMSFCLYELAMNPEVQQRVLVEVDALAEVTYDTVNSLEYLDMVVNETLRKHPPVGFLFRECSRDYLVPGTDTVIERGTQVIVPVRGLHHDSDLFPEPDRFIPERFSKKNRINIKPYTYLPFGEGPRYCIGKRFAKLMTKTGLAVLLRHFRVHRTSSTPVPVPLEPRTITINPAEGFWLRLEARRP